MLCKTKQNHDFSLASQHSPSQKMTFCGLLRWIEGTNDEIEASYQT
jgi:hypothetical protein